MVGSASRIALKNALAVELWPEAGFKRVPAHLPDCRERLRGSGGEFVRKGERLEPRAVLLGNQDSDWVEVTQGIVPGEEVVTGASFLIDSESRFKAAVEAFR